MPGARVAGQAARELTERYAQAQARELVASVPQYARARELVAVGHAEQADPSGGR